MTLLEVLSTVRSLPDLARLVHWFGHRVAWEEFDPGLLPLSGRLASRVEGAAVVGRTDGFEWLAIESVEPVAIAERVAARLAARGRLTGILALGGASRTLAVGVSVADAPVAWLELDHPEPRALQRLARLTSLHGLGGLPLALRVAEALQGEDVGRRFFLAFRSTLDRMALGLNGTVRPDQRHSLALLQLTRVLFLYFVQCKGWLDGRPDFLRHAVDDCLSRGRRLHRDLFRPLFFGTLNQAPERRGRARAFGRIPFLNGGLFEPHQLERAWRGEIPNSIWRDVFDQLFERFSFTVGTSGSEGEVAPDMLGRVFEGVMDPTTRHDSGTYYTPAHLVGRVVEAALEAHIAHHVKGPRRAATLLAERSPALRPILENVTVLDPAVGSGAFLLGMLDRLTDLLSDDCSVHQTRRRILSRCLFGVDLNPMAVRLTELRLWLAVIADDPAERSEEVTPLPNLDGLIRQGDSLLDPARLLGGLPLHPGVSGRAVAQVRQEFVVSVGEDKRNLARRLRRAELQAMIACLDNARLRLEGEAAECLAEARAHDLFGSTRGLDAALRDRLRLCRRRLGEIRRLKRRVTERGEVPWFNYEAHFADVIARGGFDLIVSNPPWVRAEDVPQAVRERLAERYRTWRGVGSGFSHQPDLAVAFVERGLELLADGGTLAFLLPSKLATAGYGVGIRRQLSSQTTLHQVVDLSTEPDVGFNATVYPMALVASKSPPAPDHLVRTGLDAEVQHPIPQQRLLGGAPWVLLPPAMHDALALVRGDHPALEEHFVLQLGAKTGLNEVFLGPPEDIEAGLIRWAIRGRDVRPFQTERRVRLLWPHDERGAVYPKLPRHAAQYFAQHEAALRSRTDYVTGPAWTAFRTRAVSAPFRVVWADIHRRLTAAALAGPGDRGCIPLNTCYLLTTASAPEARAITAWLNSTWIRAAARAVADPARGGFARFNARVVGSLPLPRAVLTDEILIQLAVAGETGSPVQDDIDARCAQHLGLPESARAVLTAVAGVRPGDRR